MRICSESVHSAYVMSFCLLLSTPGLVLKVAAKKAGTVMLLVLRWFRREER